MLKFLWRIMENWNLWIEKEEREGRGDSGNVRTGQNGIQNQFLVPPPTNDKIPPVKPQRPPEELIRRTSTNLIQFLSISDNVRLDPAEIALDPSSNAQDPILDPEYIKRLNGYLDQEHTNHLVSNPGMAYSTFRSSMKGPRDLPSNGKRFGDGTLDANVVMPQVPRSPFAKVLQSSPPRVATETSRSPFANVQQDSLPVIAPVTAPEIPPRPFPRANVPFQAPQSPNTPYQVPRSPITPFKNPPSPNTQLQNSPKSPFRVSQAPIVTLQYSQSPNTNLQHQTSPSSRLQPSKSPEIPMQTPFQSPNVPLQRALHSPNSPFQQLASPKNHHSLESPNTPLQVPKRSAHPTTPPYPIEQITPNHTLEMVQYLNHQRVLSSIMDSTGVSIQDELDYLELDPHDLDSILFQPLTPSKTTPQSIDLPQLLPMTPKRQSPTETKEKPLPKIPSPKYQGEYSKTEAISPVVLPDLPFSAKFLTDSHLEKCRSTTFLSNIWKWTLQLQSWFPNQLITLQELERCYYALFKFQIPELSEILLDAISIDVLATLKSNGNIVELDKGFLDFKDIPVSGVYPNLRDCYSPMNHIFPTPYRCYSHCCTYERLNYTATSSLQTQNMILGQDWVSHWNLSKEQLEDIVKRVQIQQSHIFDLIKSVRNLINAGKILIEVYGEGFIKNKKYFAAESNVNWDKFYEDAFDTVRDLITVTREQLFEPLIQKLNEDGKFINGISEILQIWLSEVQIPLLIYAEKRVPVYNLIKTESSLKNSKFTEWITRTNLLVPRDYNAERLFTVTFLIFFTTFKVTLLAVLDSTEVSDPEYRSLKKVLKNLDILLQKSNKTQADAERRIYVNSLKKKLIVKAKAFPEVDLKLDDKDREVFKIGSVVRKRDILHRVINDQDVVLILLDNFLLLTEETQDGNYNLIDEPIRVNYLFVEYKKFEDLPTHTQLSPRRTTTQLDVESKSFKIRHYLKSLSYFFEVDKTEEKQEWLNVFMALKAKVNQRSFQFEPFSLSVISDSLLGVEQVDTNPFKQVLAPNDNIISVLRNQDTLKLELPRVESASKILCFTKFSYKDKNYVLLGTSNGLFISQTGKPRDWKRILELKNVTQIKVLEEFDLIFILSDKTFTYYFLDAFMSSKKPVGEKLSKRDVSFFKIGKQNGVTMIFFMKLKQTYSYFKVLIPILEKSSQKVESFQEYKKFYTPGECSGLTIFNSTVVIHTKRNFEVMSLSFQHPQQVPDLNMAPELENLKKMLNQPNLKPVGIYKLINDKELLVVYNKFGIFVSKSGAISKDRLVKFSIKAQRSFFDKNLLVLSNDEFIEVWYINNTNNVNYQLVQVIAAQDLKMITDNDNSAIFSMVHPQHSDRQLLLSLDPRYS